MTRREFVRVAAVAGGSLCAAACGYSLAGRGSFLPTYIQTIGIPPFTNRTTVFNLETQLTQKVRSEFIGRGKYQILPEAANADAVLTGEVSAVSIVPASLTWMQLGALLFEQQRYGDAVQAFSIGGILGGAAQYAATGQAGTGSLIGAMAGVGLFALQRKMGDIIMNPTARKALIMAAKENKNVVVPAMINAIWQGVGGGTHREQPVRPDSNPRMDVQVPAH